MFITNRVLNLSSKEDQIRRLQTLGWVRLVDAAAATPCLDGSSAHSEAIQDKMLDLVRGGGVVVKVVSESWNYQKAGLLDRRSVHQD